MNYEAWRISFQSDEQAAKSAWVELCKVSKERDELAAYCEDSKHVIMVVASADTKEAANVIADKWIEQAPQQSLAKHDAEVISSHNRKMVEALQCTMQFGGLSYKVVTSKDILDNADKIERGES